MEKAVEIREITAKADHDLAKIIRHSLEKHELALPGTVYYDPFLEHLSTFYLEKPECRKYFVLWKDGKVCGGVGIAEFDAIEGCAEVQKLYLVDAVKGKGFGKMLLSLAEKTAKALGYRRVYVETHTNFDVALHLYRKYGYTPIERPAAVSHGTMNRFLLKDI